ncbi:hypothetical protein BJ684DRAFT_16035 [Piptocephalis cylindrospora]|uniref:Uncharacterized protein n=1 Tax=Piptocephalis cylindrospora TaxID=1907219 RepID=A0A4P9Y3V5_9FUNG|nr:hypothetical protein BJ684DRAFT_16035 [Piptocephalis cylindrospora]|eukprot:RKP13575.1 hypothetical protein BJ684DRAFT_16035 [Piptocephalis cylindrospora]
MLLSSRSSIVISLFFLMTALASITLGSPISHHDKLTSNEQSNNRRVAASEKRSADIVSDITLVFQNAHDPISQILKGADEPKKHAILRKLQQPAHTALGLWKGTIIRISSQLIYSTTLISTNFGNQDAQLGSLRTMVLLISLPPNFREPIMDTPVSSIEVTALREALLKKHVPSSVPLDHKLLQPDSFRRLAPENRAIIRNHVYYYVQMGALILNELAHNHPSSKQASLSPGTQVNKKDIDFLTTTFAFLASLKEFPEMAKIGHSWDEHAVNNLFNSPSHPSIGLVDRMKKASRTLLNHLINDINLVRHDLDDIRKTIFK